MQEQRYIIVSPARSGSTMLRIMLQRVKAASCCGEVYAKTTVRGATSNSGLSRKGLLVLRNKFDELFLEDIDFTADKSTGIKILYEQFFGAWAANFVCYLTENPDIKVVHLWRRDLIARYFSQLLHLAKSQHRDTSVPTVITRECSGEEIYRESKRTISVAKLVDRVLDGHPIYHVAYEDILASAEKRLELLTFLGLQDYEEKFVIPDQIVNENESLIELNISNRDAAIAEFKTLLRFKPLGVIA